MVFCTLKCLRHNVIICWFHDMFELEWLEQPTGCACAEVWLALLGIGDWMDLWFGLWFIWLWLDFVNRCREEQTFDCYKLLLKKLKNK